MNPTQYKQAMRQRALDRRAELSREAAASPSERSLGMAHPPRDSRGGQQQHGLVPKLQLQRNDNEGDSAATSPATCSSTGGGGLVEGFGAQDKVEERGDSLRNIGIEQQ